MKKRNHKIFLATIAISVNVSFIATPFTAITYAATTMQTEDNNIDVKLDGKNNVSSIANSFTLTNKGKSVDLSKVKLRYYFTSDEGSDGQAFACYYSALSGLNNKNINLTEHVHGNFIKLDKTIETADSYLEISFDEKAGSFDSSDVLTLNTAINNKTWSKINSDDDYSFNDAAKTVVLVDDEVVSGTAPISKEKEIPRVTLGGVTVKGGDSVSVPINVSNIKNMGVSKFHMKVSFDSNIFKMDNCSLSADPVINKLGNKVETGKWYKDSEHSIDIGYDFSKDENTKALYKDCDYMYIPLKAINTLEDGLSYLNIMIEPTLTDANGKEYSGDAITIDNKPITLKYNKDVVKDSSISQNYLTFDESTVKDTDITMKKYENAIKSITRISETSYKDSDSTTLSSGTDYEVSDNTLTLKEDFLKTLLDKNHFITINFDKGMSQTIFVNNTKLETVSDPLRSGINNNEANISLGNYTPDNASTKNSPLTFTITNTSNINMDLEKLNLNYYYNKIRNRESNEYFQSDYCSILGSNKDLRSVSTSTCEPIYCDWYYNERCYIKESFDKKAGVLKPGETLVFRGHIIAKEGFTIRDAFQEPVVTYNGESIYGELPDEYKRDSEILSDNIVLDSSENSDTPIELKLNSNVLKSIAEYSEGKRVKTLKKGTDYVLSNRNKIILTKAYLDSISDNTTLDFKFSSGHDATLNIKCFDYSSELKEGNLTIENAASIGYSETGICGGPYSAWWGKLTVPITLTNPVNEEATYSSIILKFNKYLFDDVQVEPLESIDEFGSNSISSAEVNYELGIIKITLNKNIYKTSKGPDFNLIFTPNGNTDPQKVDLSLDDSSYYETEFGIFKPVFKYNDIELVSKNESRYDSNN